MKLAKLSGFAFGAHFAIACSGPAPEPAALPEPTRTHAVLWIEQQPSTLEDKSADTGVTLGVLRVPLTVNSNRLLELMGLGNEFPPVGSCEIVDTSTHSAPALSSFERVELLDIGDISITSVGEGVRLSRQAFPTVTDFISGVLYTTRERATALSLKNGVTLHSRGNSAIPAFSVGVDTIDIPEAVTVDTVALSELARVNTMSSFELHWKPGRPSDRIWVEMGANHGKRTLSCTFDDSAGAGIVPSMQTNEVGEGRLTFHRISSKSLAIHPLDRAEVRLDVRVMQPVVLY